MIKLASAIISGLLNIILKGKSPSKTLKSSFVLNPIIFELISFDGTLLEMIFFLDNTIH